MPRRLIRRGIVTLAAVLTVVGVWQVAAGAAIHAKAHVAQHLLHRAWDRTLRGEADVRPWPWADTWPVARLRVPAHGVDLIVLDGVSGRTLAFGPGHVSTSVRPGAAGTAILSGHRDTHFRFLARLAPGDEIVIETTTQRLARFRVHETAVVDGRHGVVRTDRDEARLVLVTCYPFEAVVPGGPLRWIVAAERADG